MQFSTAYIDEFVLQQPLAYSMSDNSASGSMVTEQFMDDSSSSTTATFSSLPLVPSAQVIEQDEAAFAWLMSSQDNYHANGDTSSAGYYSPSSSSTGGEDGIVVHWQSPEACAAPTTVQYSSPAIPTRNLFAFTPSTQSSQRSSSHTSSSSSSSTSSSVREKQRNAQATITSIAKQQPPVPSIPPPATTTSPKRRSCGTSAKAKKTSSTEEEEKVVIAPPTSPSNSAASKPRRKRRAGPTVPRKGKRKSNQKEADDAEMTAVPVIPPAVATTDYALFSAFTQLHYHQQRLIRAAVEFNSALADSCTASLNFEKRMLYATDEQKSLLYRLLPKSASILHDLQSVCSFPPVDLNLLKRPALLLPPNTPQDYSTTD